MIEKVNGCFFMFTPLSLSKYHLLFGVNLHINIHVIAIQIIDIAVSQCCRDNKNRFTIQLRFLKSLVYSTHNISSICFLLLKI